MSKRVVRGRGYIRPNKPPLNLCFAIVMQAIEDARQSGNIRSNGAVASNQNQLRQEAVMFLRDDPVARGIVARVAPNFDYDLILEGLA